MVQLEITAPTDQCLHVCMWVEHAMRAGAEFVDQMAFTRIDISAPETIAEWCIIIDGKRLT